MGDEFSAWDCSWYWDNGFANLLSAGTSPEDGTSAVGTNDIPLTDSAFCELEADSICNKESYFEKFRLFITRCESTLDDGMEESLSISICDDQSRIHMTTDGDSDSAAPSSVEICDTSDQESVGHSVECDSSSSVMDLSASCCLSETETCPALNEHQGNELGKHEKLAVASTCVDASLNTSSPAGDTGSASLQHRPLVFFIIGLFVGLSLGFFTCIVTVSAAVHRMHLEIVNGRSLYSQCQHQCRRMHETACTEVTKVSMDETIGSIWREKFEEMVVENAELQLKLSSLEGQMSDSLDWMEGRIGRLSVELSALKCTTDASDSSVTVDCQSRSLTGDNNNAISVDKTDAQL